MRKLLLTLRNVSLVLVVALCAVATPLISWRQFNCLITPRIPTAGLDVSGVNLQVQYHPLALWIHPSGNGARLAVDERNVVATLSTTSDANQVQAIRIGTQVFFAGMSVPSVQAYSDGERATLSGPNPEGYYIAPDLTERFHKNSSRILVDDKAVSFIGCIDGVHYRS